MVSCQELYAICCWSFYVKPALLIELYLTLQTDFAAVVLGFLPMTPIEQIYPPLLERSFVSGIVKNVR